MHSINDGSILWTNEKGEITTLSNFTAQIEEENRYVDGKKTDRFYLISGVLNEEELDQVLVSADQFANMSWVTKAWGSQAIIFPGGSSKEYLRTAIQIESDPKINTIYTHTGWITIDKKPHFLSNHCTLTEKKRRTDVDVLIPADLKSIGFPSQIGDVKLATQASLDSRKLGPLSVMWVILGAIYRTPIGPIDFSIHITGRTGTYKSELASIAQSHFGECSARELPASWSSTSNALAALAYRAKNVVMVVDDFIPSGTSYQCKAYQKTADEVFRAQANQQGRARLTDTSMMQQTMFPRGMILSTGEDTPEGHSVRGRMMIGELTTGDITTEQLTKVQNNRHLFADAMASYIQWLAGDLQAHKKEVSNFTEEIRDLNLTIGHARTPTTMGSILSGVMKFLQFAIHIEAIDTGEAIDLYSEAEHEIRTIALHQNEYLIAADPGDQFISIIRGIFAGNAGHIKGKFGGVPKKALLLGWTIFGNDDDADYKPHGPRLGWADDRNQVIYLDATIAYDTVRRHSRGAITITRQTLYKRLRESGHLAEVDETRQRNTIRLQLEGATRNVLAIRMKAITEGDET